LDEDIFSKKFNARPVEDHFRHYNFEVFWPVKECYKILTKPICKFIVILYPDSGYELYNMELNQLLIK